MGSCVSSETTESKLLNQLRRIHEEYKQVESGKVTGVKLLKSSTNGVSIILFPREYDFDSKELRAILYSIDGELCSKIVDGAVMWMNCFLTKDDELGYILRRIEKKNNVYCDLTSKFSLFTLYANNNPVFIEENL